MVVAGRNADGDVALGTGVDLRGASRTRAGAARAALECDGEQAFGREPVEVIGGERAADPDLGGHLISAHRAGLARDVLVDAAPGGVPKRAQGLQRVHSTNLSLTNIDKCLPWGVVSTRSIAYRTVRRSPCPHFKMRPPPDRGAAAPAGREAGHQAYLVLRTTFVVAPVAFGIDTPPSSS